MIGRSYISNDNAEAAELFLADFIKRAVPEDEIRQVETDEADDYLSMFIDHVSNPNNRHHPAQRRGDISEGEINIVQSHFISNYAELDQSSGINLIRLSQAHITPTGTRIEARETTLIGYVLEGEGDVTVNGGTYHCRKYDCFFLDCSKGVNLRAYPGKPWQLAFIRAGGRFHSDLFPNLSNYLLQNVCLFTTFGSGTRFRSIIWGLLGYHTENSHQSEYLYPRLILGIFLELDMSVTMAAKKSSIIPDVILGIQNYLDKNYSSDINLDLLAKRFSISKYHMAREFKRCIGKSPIDYLIDVRITRAKDLLYDSNRSVSDIGQLVGIPNPNHFLYLFKEREGLTPSTFRKDRR